ncbi:MAG: hypothetical protein ACRDDY_03475 [Clostridium sp.]
MSRYKNKCKNCVYYDNLRRFCIRHLITIHNRISGCDKKKEEEDE